MTPIDSTTVQTGPAADTDAQLENTKGRRQPQTGASDFLSLRRDADRHGKRVTPSPTARIISY